jgi:hypothetical protein
VGEGMAQGDLVEEFALGCGEAGQGGDLVG